MKKKYKPLIIQVLKSYIYLTTFQISYVIVYTEFLNSFDKIALFQVTQFILKQISVYDIHYKLEELKQKNNSFSVILQS